MDKELQGCPINQKYCAEAKCAWWNGKGKGECAVSAIAKSLQQIASKVSLGDVRMP